MALGRQNAKALEAVLVQMPIVPLRHTQDPPPPHDSRMGVPADLIGGLSGLLGAENPRGVDTVRTWPEFLQSETSRIDPTRATVSE